MIIFFPNIPFKNFIVYRFKLNNLNDDEVLSSSITIKLSYLEKGGFSLN